MVTQKNFSMKNVSPFLIQAAKYTGISYSTAKKIFTSFRSTLKPALTKMVTNLNKISLLNQASYV